MFFLLHLAEVLEAVTGVPVAPRLLPEFPVNRGLIWPESPRKQSVKVDVQPTKAPDEAGVIDFPASARVVDRHPDEVSELLARHLRLWTSIAGAARPG